MLRSTIALALATLPACVVAGAPLSIASSGRSHDETSSAESQVRYLQNAPVIANPVSGTIVTTVPGSRVAGDDVAAALQDQELDATLTSYVNDTLCVRFHSVTQSKSNERPHFDESLRNNYRLYAPSSLRPSIGTPSIGAARIAPLDFHAAHSETTYDTSGRDTIVAQNHYRVDQRFDVCFDHASSVLKSQSSYALVEFRYDNGDLGFQYAWRFEPSSQTATR